MGLLDIFKTTPPTGNNMSPEERKRLFWYIKRKSSYTAWKREADAFDRFADLFEKQVVEEPTPERVKSLDGTDWEFYFTEILEAQVDYEDGLMRLRQGDRTVFLYNSLGVLYDALVTGSSWYERLALGGRHGDKAFDGKYVPAMTEAIKEYNKCSKDTGYLEPRLDPAVAEESWCEWTKQQLMRACHMDSYDDVPTSSLNVTVKSGDEAPVFGIYDPQVDGGCLNYLWGGVAAPLLTVGYETGRDIPVTWRLIWKDDRYLDGQIPDEENDYFPPEEPAMPAQTSIPTEETASARTGAPCPKPGVWAVLDDIHGRVELKQGETMPQFNGRNVTWVWTSR